MCHGSGSPAVLDHQSRFVLTCLFSTYKGVRADEPKFDLSLSLSLSLSVMLLLTLSATPAFVWFAVVSR